VKPFYLSDENCSTYRVKPLYFSNRYIFQIQLVRLRRVAAEQDARKKDAPTHVVGRCTLCILLTHLLLADWLKDLSANEKAE
jgi:hypothetical protein